MEINKKSVEKLCSLSDDALKEKIRAAAEACGADGDAAVSRLKDLPALKRRISSLSDAQIKAICQAVGEDKLDRIKRSLGDGPDN